MARKDQQFRYRPSAESNWTEWYDRWDGESDCMGGVSGLDYQFRAKPELKLEPGLYRHPAGVGYAAEFYTLSRELRWSYLKNSNLTWDYVRNNKPCWSLESLEKLS